MQYELILMKDVMDRLQYQFRKTPFIMQSAFALTNINIQTDICTIIFDEFISLGEADYEYHTPDKMSFYSRVLLDVLHKACQEGKSLIYMHFHPAPSPNASMFENDDHKMIFRISYAYVPFGIHASLYFINDKITGKIWLPTLSTVPLCITYHE
jgi:hypothetical protein